MPRIDMTGQRYGRLLVIKYSGSYPLNGGAMWLCSCDCGNTTIVPRQSLKYGRTMSCGCLAREAGVRNAPLAHAAATRHGMTGTKLHITWVAMKARCLTKSAGNYKNYGGKGVKVCQEWINSFEQFAKDVGEPPSHIHSLDRINPFGDYEPSNVRWATPKEQANNRRVHWRNKCQTTCADS